MINTILTVIAIICLTAWTYFSIKQEQKFNDIYDYIRTMKEQNDEKVLEYTLYVAKAIKNNQTILNYSTWVLK